MPLATFVRLLFFVVPSSPNYSVKRFQGQRTDPEQVRSLVAIKFEKGSMGLGPMDAHFSVYRGKDKRRAYPLGFPDTWKNQRFLPKKAVRF